MAKQVLANEATFGVQRQKINDNFTEVYDGIRPYKVYSALMAYNGSAFTMKVLENTIGNIVWSNPSNGRIDGTLATVFTLDKTMVLNGGLSSYFVSGRRQSNDFISLFFTYFDNTSSGTPTLTTLPIEIRVYA